MDSCGSTITEESSTPSTSEDNSLEKACLTKVTVSLLKLIEKTGYRLEQINGQRRYGGPPPNWEGPPPVKGSEIFVGKIPRDCFEDELVPVFETVGQIYELRLMMDFSGSNRGFAFVMYLSPEIADLAVQRLNNFEIRGGRRIGVVKSVNNCKLFIGGLPADKSEEDIKCVLCRLTEGVTDIWLYRNAGTIGTKSRPAVQYAIVEYDSHRSAAMARRRLIPERVQLWGREIIVDWATPQSRTNKPGDQDVCEELVQINKLKQQKLASASTRKGCSYGQGCESGYGTLSSRSSSNWSLEQAMDDALYGNSCLDSPAFYVAENANNALDLVKAVLPNVSGLSSSEIQMLASALMKNFNAGQLPTALMNRNAAKAKMRGNSKPGTGRNSELKNVAALGFSIKGRKVKSGLGDDSTAFGTGENVHPQQGWQDTRGKQLYRPAEHMYLTGSARAQLLLADLMKKNENKHVPMPERPVLSELSFGQSHSFANTGRSNSLREVFQLPIEEMNIYQLSNSNAAVGSSKPEQVPLLWLRDEAGAYQELVPPMKYSLESANKSNLDTIWERGTNNLPYEGNTFANGNDMIGNVASAASDVPLWTKYNTMTKNTFTPHPENAMSKSSLASHADASSTFATNRDIALARSAFATHLSNAVARSTYDSHPDLCKGILDNSSARDGCLKAQTEISKENCLRFWGTGNLTDSCMDVDMETCSRCFNRAPGGPVHDITKYINQ